MAVRPLEYDLVVDAPDEIAGYMLAGEFRRLGVVVVLERSGDGWEVAVPTVAGFGGHAAAMAIIRGWAERERIAEIAFSVRGQPASMAAAE